MLTHWDQVTHICISDLTIIGSDNGLSPSWCQAIIWTNAGLLLIGPLVTNFNLNMKTFFEENALENVGSKMAAFCLSLNVLNLPCSLHDYIIKSHHKWLAKLITLHCIFKWYEYPKDFTFVTFVIVPPYFVQKQYLWNNAIQPVVGCSAYKVIYVVRAAHC